MHVRWRLRHLIPTFILAGGLCVGGICRASAGVSRCEADLGVTSAEPGPTTEWTRNGHVPLEEYDLTNDRTLNEYDYMLGGLMKAHLPADSWMDIGSGFALAPLEAASEYRVERAVAINAQDALKPLRELDYAWFARHATAAKAGLHEAFGTRAATERAFRRLIQLEDHGRFRYVVGFAERRLPIIRESFEILTDLFGAYFYSAERPYLLSEYYAHLAEGGRAFVIVRGHNIKWTRRGGELVAAVQVYGPDNFVRSADHRRRKFEDVLVERYPTIFSLRTANSGKIRARSRHQILVMTRDPNIASLEDLRALHRVDVTFGASGVHAQIPSATWEFPSGVE